MKCSLCLPAMHMNVLLSVYCIQPVGLQYKHTSKCMDQAISIYHYLNNVFWFIQSILRFKNVFICMRLYEGMCYHLETLAQSKQLINSFLCKLKNKPYSVHSTCTGYGLLRSNNVRPELFENNPPIPPVAKMWIVF